MEKTGRAIAVVSTLVSFATQAQAGNFNFTGVHITGGPTQAEPPYQPYVEPPKPPIPLTATDDEILLHYLPVEDSGANYAPIPEPPVLPTAPYGMVARQKMDLRSGCVLVQTEKGGLPKCPKWNVWFERDWSIPQTEHERQNVEKMDALGRGADRLLGKVIDLIGDGVNYAATKEIEAERAEAAAKAADPSATIKPRMDQPATAIQSGSASGNGHLQRHVAAPNATALPEGPSLPNSTPVPPKKAAPVGPVETAKPSRQRIPFVPESFLESIEKIAKARVAHMWGLDAVPVPVPPDPKLVAPMPPKPKGAAKPAENKLATRHVHKPVELNHGPDLSDGHYRGAPPSINEPPQPSGAPRPEVEQEASVGKNAPVVPAHTYTFPSAFGI